MIERSTYVSASNLVLALQFWQCRPIPAVVWDVSATNTGGTVPMLIPATRGGAARRVR